MNPVLFICNARYYGVTNLELFHADHDSCMKISWGCSSSVLIVDIQAWCAAAIAGDRKVFGETLIIALPREM